MIDDEEKVHIIPGDLYDPLLEFGSGKIPPDVIPTTTEGEDETYVLLVKVIDFAPEYVVDIQSGLVFSELIQQLEWDILKLAKHVEWTKIIKVPANVSHSYEIDIAFRRGLFARIYHNEYPQPEKEY